jgi:hypothetical protein
MHLSALGIAVFYRARSRLARLAFVAFGKVDSRKK